MSHRGEIKKRQIGKIYLLLLLYELVYLNILILVKKARINFWSFFVFVKI